MAKVLLVEDDNNLREIYEARMQAEGYDVVTASDGEQALVVAKAEKPDLVVSDVMMPKISGFEMLDILRNTDGMQAVKVIMLTALGQTDDQARADRLGADRYLVKSQVTLEDIVNVAHQLLGDAPAAPDPTPVAATPAPEPVVAPAGPVAVAPAPEPTVAPELVATPAPAPTPTTSFAAVEVAPTPTPPADPLAVSAAMADDKLMADAMNNLTTNTATEIGVDGSATVVAPTEPEAEAAPVAPTAGGTKVIAPLDASEAKPDINELLAKEEAKTMEPSNIITPSSDPTPDAPSSAQEEAAVEAQIADFVSGATSDPTPAATAATQAAEQVAATAAAIDAAVVPAPAAEPVVATPAPAAPVDAPAPAPAAAPEAVTPAVAPAAPAETPAAAAPEAAPAAAPAPASTSDGKVDPNSIAL